MIKTLLVLCLLAPGALLFADSTKTMRPPADDDVPFFADDSMPQYTGPRYGPGRPKPIEPVKQEESAAPPPSRFAGSLDIRTDTGDSLPVYVNGKKVGVTPFRIDHCAVGKYVVSYMDSLLRDSLQNDDKRMSREAIPALYAPLFKGRKIDVPIALKSLADYAEQNIIIRNNESVEVVFTVRDMLSSTDDTKKTYYGRVVLGAAIITAVGLILIVSAN